ncbi:MAG: hypothetical protein GY874_23790 [Desulfobacteraceae bacterium]|nr:hypothetical protein [Desulfobacteraceae bacterium]
MAQVKTKLKKRSSYSAVYDHPNSYRTSNMLDRLMQRFFFRLMLDSRVLLSCLMSLQDPETQHEPFFIENSGAKTATGMVVVSLSVEDDTE